MNLLIALLTAPIRIVQIAREFEKRGPAMETIIRADDPSMPGRDGWKRIEANQSASGHVEYTRKRTQPSRDPMPGVTIVDDTL